MVKTKFDDALKILVAHERWLTELSVANMQCVNLVVLLFSNCLYSTDRRHLLPSIASVLASDGRAHNSILKVGWPKKFF